MQQINVCNKIKCGFLDRTKEQKKKTPKHLDRTCNSLKKARESRRCISGKVHVSFLRSTDASNDLLDSERNIPPAATGRASAEWKTDNSVNAVTADEVSE